MPNVDFNSNDQIFPPFVKLLKKTNCLFKVAFCKCCLFLWWSYRLSAQAVVFRKCLFFSKSVQRKSPKYFQVKPVLTFGFINKNCHKSILFIRKNVQFLVVACKRDIFSKTWRLYCSRHIKLQSRRQLRINYNKNNKNYIFVKVLTSSVQCHIILL